MPMAMEVRMLSLLKRLDSVGLQFVSSRGRRGSANLGWIGVLNATGHNSDWRLEVDRIRAARHDKTHGNLHDRNLLGMGGSSGVKILFLTHHTAWICCDHTMKLFEIELIDPFPEGINCW
jgi:hypothetical protein